MFYPKEKIEANFPRHELEIAGRDGRFEDEDWRLRKDGSRLWARVVITALHDDAGELVGFAKVTSDLTSRQEADEALRRSEEQVRLLVQQVQDYAILIARSERQRRQLERRRTRYQGVHRGRDRRPLVRHVLSGRINRRRGTGSRARGAPETRILLIDDDEFDRLAVRRCLSEAGIVTTVDEVSTAVDAITRIGPNAYDCVVDQLREKEARFRTLANAIPQLAWITDAAGAIGW